MKTAKEPTPLERYRELRKDAAFLRETAGPNAMGGPSFWEGIRESTAAAIACKFEPLEGVTWQLSRAQKWAIWSVQDLTPMWLAAADFLDRQAAELISDLEKQAAEVAATIGELKGEPKP